MALRVWRDSPSLIPPCIIKLFGSSHGLPTQFTFRLDCGKESLARSPLLAVFADLFKAFGFALGLALGFKLG